MVWAAVPGGTVATGVYFGPYDGLAAPHRAVREWRKAHGPAIAMPFRVVYGHREADPAERQTDVVALLEGGRAR